MLPSYVSFFPRLVIQTPKSSSFRLTSPQPGIYPTPFPYASQLHVPAETSVDHMTDLALSHLSLLFKQQIPAHEVACIVIEPVLGEGGYVPAPKAWLQGLREICDREGIILGES